MRGAIADGEEAMRNPIRGILLDCCASATVSRKRVSGKQTILLLINIEFAPVLLLLTANRLLPAVI
jgi:hypothetical protein